MKLVLDLSDGETAAIRYIAAREGLSCGDTVRELIRIRHENLKEVNNRGFGGPGGSEVKIKSRLLTLTQAEAEG